MKLMTSLFIQCMDIQVILQLSLTMMRTIIPIIGWAFDGNPIYGPYGYSTRDDVQSGVRLLKSGYTANSNSVDNRPPVVDYPEGFFS